MKMITCKDIEFQHAASSVQIYLYYYHSSNDFLTTLSTWWQLYVQQGFLDPHGWRREFCSTQTDCRHQRNFFPLCWHFSFSTALHCWEAARKLVGHWLFMSVSLFYLSNKEHLYEAAVSHPDLLRPLLISITHESQQCGPYWGLYRAQLFIYLFFTHTVGVYEDVIPSCTWAKLGLGCAHYTLSVKMTSVPSLITFPRTLNVFVMFCAHF